MKHIAYPDYVSYLTYIPERRTLVPNWKQGITAEISGANHCNGRAHSETVSVEGLLPAG